MATVIVGRFYFAKSVEQPKLERQLDKTVAHDEIFFNAEFRAPDSRIARLKGTGAVPLAGIVAPQPIGRAP